MSEFATVASDAEQRIFYNLGDDGAYHVVTQDTPEQVKERFGGIPEVDLIFMYPPIGSQRVNMGRALWEENAHFKEVHLHRHTILPRALHSASAAPSSRRCLRATRSPKRCCHSHSWRYRRARRQPSKHYAQAPRYSR